MYRSVRRHINWNTWQPDLREDLAHLVDNIKQCICYIASAASPGTKNSAQTPTSGPMACTVLLQLLRPAIETPCSAAGVRGPGL
jgi:hypothetical protein